MKRSYRKSTSSLQLLLEETLPSVCGQCFLISDESPHQPFHALFEQDTALGGGVVLQPLTLTNPTLVRVKVAAVHFGNLSAMDFFPVWETFVLQAYM